MNKLIKINLILKNIISHKTIPTAIKGEELSIVEDNFIRENEVDRLYRKFYKNKLCLLFNNRCAVCSKIDNGLDLDHFMIPKIKGGNFLLRLTNGALLNNAIPLCQTCNRKKGSSSITNLTSIGDVENISTLSKSFSRKVLKDHLEGKYQKLFSLL